jgi:hypothetical protein
MTTTSTSQSMMESPATIPTPQNFIAEKVFREKSTLNPAKANKGYRKYGNQGKKSMKVRTQLWACDRNQKKGKEVIVGKKVHQKKNIEQGHHAATLRSQVKMKRN